MNNIKENCASGVENLKKAIELLKSRKEFLREQFGVVRLGIFGSFAKCKASQKSDIDIYIEFDMNRLTFDKYLELIEYLESLFGRRIDVITKGGLESIRIPYVRRSIERSITYV